MGKQAIQIEISKKGRVIWEKVETPEALKFVGYAIPFRLSSEWVLFYRVAKGSGRA